MKRIQYLKLRKVFLVLKAFQAHVKGWIMIIQTDNTTTMLYLNKQGSSLIPTVKTSARDMEVGNPTEHDLGNNSPFRVAEHRSGQPEQARKHFSQMGDKTGSTGQCVQTGAMPNIGLFATPDNAKC